MSLESSPDPFTREIFARHNQRTLEVFADALQGLLPDIAADVVHIAGALLDLYVRQRVVGHHLVPNAYDRLRHSVEVILLFSELGTPLGSVDRASAL